MRNLFDPALEFLVLLWLVPWGFFLGFMGGWIFSRPMVAGHFMDMPGLRSSHAAPTPKGGGVGIVLAVLWAWIFLGHPFAMIPCFIMISFLGLFSDRRDISPLFRLSMHILLALFAVIAGSPFLPLLSFPGIILYTLFWTLFIAATANFYNFMDGINGIAALSGATGFILMALFQILHGGWDRNVLLLLAAASACLGFVPMNFPRAKVFMGDTGSLFLGFFFAAMVMLFSTSHGDFLLFFSFLAPFYCDELTTMAIRLKNRENIFKPHRKHLYQILVNQRRISHLKVTLFYAMVQAIFGLMMIYIHSLGRIMPLVTMLLLFFVLFGIISRRIRQGQNEL
ncbi:MAG: hypothetical protein HQK66_13420 [Desulfamplus sp.]|nr:hypothetical protein [Desulfamplus sp.]